MKKLLALLFVLLSLPSYAQIVSPGGTFIAAGGTLSGCTVFSFVYVDTNGNLACSRTPINGSVSTAGRSVLTIRDTISGSSLTSNFLNVTGALPAVTSTTTPAVFLEITGNGSSANGQWAFFSRLLAGYTGALDSSAGRFVNNSAGTGTAFLVNGNAGNHGVFATSQSATTGTNIGVMGNANAGADNYGIVGHVSFGGSYRGAGVAGFALSGAGSRAALYGGMTAAAPTIDIDAVALLDNFATAVPLMVARVNNAALPSTGPTATFQIKGTGQAQCGNCALTSATMTAVNQAEMRTVTHSYAWTNAMLVALGASLTGDVNVAVLPAKTQVNAAFVVIDTPGTDANTLTVSCGDTGAGAANYVKAGDAKAAANTVYGDAITGAETGTSLFSTFFITNYVPSYTATTTVSCRFTKTVGNLSTQTGSTGRVILTTTLLP